MCVEHRLHFFPLALNNQVPTVRTQCHLVFLTVNIFFNQMFRGFIHIAHPLFLYVCINEDSYKKLYEDVPVVIKLGYCKKHMYFAFITKFRYTTIPSPKQEP